MTRGVTTACLGLTLVVACNRGPDATAPSADAVTPAVASGAEPASLARAAAPEALRAAQTRSFGLPIPAGVTLEDEAPGVQHYRVSAEYPDIVAFFDSNVDGGVTVTEYERGARIEPSSGQGEAVYVYRETAANTFTLSYFDAQRRGASGSSGPTAGAVSAGASDPGPSAATPTATAPGGMATRPAAIQQRFGNPLPDDAQAADSSGPAPIGSPLVIDGGAGMPTGPRTVRPPLRFVRGVQEPRRNPDAEF